MKKWITIGGVSGFLAVVLGAGGVCGHETLITLIALRI
jgi:hypothetical protein